MSLVLLAALLLSADPVTPKVPILHSTDLFHPHGDPDDHYDLACLFATGEFDVKGVILDLGEEQAKRCGRPAVEQMMHITGRRVPCSIGLSQRLRGPSDKALGEPARFQEGVELILSTLRQSPEPVALFTTGSCRDVAAAFNREPELLRQKVRAVYFNIGRGPNEDQNECNVGYDPAAYLRMFQTGLPIYWCPCFGRDGYETLFAADQTEVVGACTPAVQNFFVYCLTRSKDDPIKFLTTGPHPAPSGPRSMWCTAPMLHAAGRKVYQRGDKDFIALRPAEAQKAGLVGREIRAFDFVPMRVTIDGVRAEVLPEAAEPRPGHLSAAYRGRTEDRVGTNRPEPDGRPDCCVQVRGLPAERPIKNIVITGPNQGRWEYVATGRWWRVAYDRHAGRLDAWFQFYASGPHRIELVFADGQPMTAEFTVLKPDPARFHVDLAAKEPNGWVFRATDPRFKQIMAACLKNLLADLGR